MRLDAFGKLGFSASMVLAIVYLSGENGIDTEEIEEEFGKLKYFPLALFFFFTQGIFCK